VRRRAWPILVLALLLTAPAAEAAKRPPRAKLQGNGESARIGPWSYSWSHPSGPEYCAGVASDGIPGYDARIDVAHPHAKPRVVILRDRRPRVLSFRAYAELDSNGLTNSDGKRVASDVEPRLRNGNVVAWVIAFRVNVAVRPYFDLDLGFRPRGRCDEGGSASYAFGIGHD
jgi:hypothetical protein